MERTPPKFSHYLFQCRSIVDVIEKHLQGKSFTHA